MESIKTPKKLIEVALPLDDINEAAAREKSIRHGHPSTLHLWWARRPLAAARAVIFAQMVNDPGYDRSLKRGLRKEEALVERERLFQIIRDLVKWENTNNEEVLERAREEIRKSWRETCELNKDYPKAKDLFNPDKLPAFHDPFAGGGSIPLEAQRLGLETYASDLNPVAVIINKAMIEVPPKFTGLSPVNVLSGEGKTELFQKNWTGANGLAEDVQSYGMWMLEEAYKKIGHLYPFVEITNDVVQERPDLKDLLGKKVTVIAWIWTRTVSSPNPACSREHVPLASTFVLSSRIGKEAYVQPIIENGKYVFKVRLGKSPKGFENGTKLSRGANFRCILSDSPIEQKHIRDEFKAKRNSERLMAIVAESEKGRIYLSPTLEHEEIARSMLPKWRPEVEMNQDCKDLLSGRGYGVKFWHELFSPRQLVTLSTFSDLLKNVHEKCKNDAVNAKMKDDNKSLVDGGVGAEAYSEAVCMYLAFAISKVANIGSTITSWMNDRGAFRETFARQAIPMVWDYAEANPFSTAGGSFVSIINKGSMAISTLPASGIGKVFQADASVQGISQDKVVSTDPPYYDNISYADLSDFFYVWLRYSLKEYFPELFATMAVPKADELIAASYRHGNKEKANNFFLDGMTNAIHNLANRSHPAFPVTIYYAFKQSETQAHEGTHSTGWETFLEALIKANFSIVGTWPMRTEGEGRMIGQGTNALASSIILVCRKRDPAALTISRRDFIRELNSVLPEALDEMTRGGVNSPVTPVDLSQAIIGPGMAIFSKYTAVLEADGKPMTVRTALQLINRFLAEDDFDHDTQFCLHWFENQGWAEGKFGDANTLAQAKGTSVEGVRDAGVIEAKTGKVRLLKFTEYSSDWNPANDKRVPIWEALHYMIRFLKDGGASAAGVLLAQMPTRGESIRQLAYRLYTLCERKGWSEDARFYNELVGAWSAIESESNKSGHRPQIELFN